MKALIYSSLLFIKIILLPNQSLLCWMAICIALDFVTGFSKAVILKQARTSNGMRRTITKFLQYGGALAVGIILRHAAELSKQEGVGGLLSYFNDSLVVFIIYIEVTSIFENLYACDQSSMISKMVYKPVLKLLTAQMKGNPIVQATEAADEKEKNASTT